MELVLIPAGKFLMGSPEGDKDAFDAEHPQHRVRITRPFYLSATEVTRGQFRQFVKEAGYQIDGGWQNTGFKQTDDHPVVNVSWNDAVAFCKWLSRKEEVTYRLPTEAEWEYACRAGTTTRYSFGDDEASLGEFAWFIGNSKGATHPVGQKSRNSWGLHDMYSNAWEWCSDGYADDYYKRSPVDDPQGVEGATVRVIRGGGWFSGPRSARAANRNGYAPGSRDISLGFRLARVQSVR
jgi:formylglycine-generating enzyme required for sulfatase activity